MLVGVTGTRNDWTQICFAGEQQTKKMKCLADQQQKKGERKRVVG